MRESSKAALGGIVAALSVVIMLATYLSPLLVYTAPPFAGILLIVILEELDLKWAFGTYVAISLLSLFMIADKEAAVFFTLFFGYYPILRAFFSTKIKKKQVLLLLGWIVFNVASAAAILLCAFVFHIDYGEFYENGKLFVILTIFLMNVVFIVYDFLLVRVHTYYRLKIKSKIKKIFK